MTNGNNFSKSQYDRMKRLSKRFSITVGIVIFLIVLSYIGFQLFTEYIWMDTLNFGEVYTTILYSKVLLGVSGFVLFFILTFLTLYWIRLSYMNHFSPVQLPSFIAKGKTAYLIIGASAVFIGLTGSLIVQGLGWEPALKLINHTSFNKVDPF